ncbi:hypothetical protein STVIR_8779 [Streptomyces viridochromogenes Tue57]|uniref:Uncharacterized protein n=1 Tax=Streptomyces viridochromogenes Tue57 TaxID=1160705 RepID=L8P2A3_STRVR|nr:hypothetical protein STVIR_8779 [Streptomyces viridochromogenes Tue57]
MSAGVWYISQTRAEAPEPMMSKTLAPDPETS